MITDDDRRRIAAKLRRLDYADLQESLICAYLDALGIEGYADWVGISHRLADLIEPPTQCPYYRSDRHYCSVHDVPTIDHEALLALADRLSEPNIVQDYWYTTGIARLIRKALGVEDHASHDDESA